MLDFGPGSFFLTPSQLADSPSSRHGICASTENALRFYACEIIQEASILLRLPQAVPATAQVLLHRFFCKQSFRDFDARLVAASCFWLSMKLEEVEGASYRGGKPSQLNDVISMFEHIRARREGTPPLPRHAPAFKVRKEEILKLETRILVELGFVCHVEHPHKSMMGYLHVLEASKELTQECWNLVNDSLRTTLCVFFSSNVIACGIIYAAARRLRVPLPESPPWWLLFDVTLNQILNVCVILTDLYRQSKSHFLDVRTSSSKPMEVASSLSETSDAVTSTKSPESEASHLVSKPVIKSVDVSCSRHDVPASSSASTSKIIDSCLLKSSGLPSSKVVDAACFPRRSIESKKRAREDSEELERKSQRTYSHEFGDKSEDYRHTKYSHRDMHRNQEGRNRRREDYLRCSRYYDNRSFSTRYNYSHVRG